MTDPGSGLDVRELTASYGAARVLHGVSFSAEAGKITGLIGPNGAGKTTAFNAISGLVRNCTGEVSVFGRPALGKPPFRIARLGMVRTFQLARELTSLSVLENLMLPPPQPGERLVDIFLNPRRVRQSDRQVYGRAREVLEIIGLTRLADTRAMALSGGQKKLLELGRALMAAPRLILLDEPGAGVNPALMDQLCGTIAEINNEHGISFLIIEHDMALIRRLCSHVIVMAQGRTMIEGSFDTVVSDPRVIEAYLGKVIA